MEEASDVSGEKLPVICPGKNSKIFLAFRFVIRSFALRFCLGGTEAPFATVGGLYYAISRTTTTRCKHEGLGL